MDKYFYVRKDSTIGNDDDAVNGSNLFPVATWLGMESSSDTTSTMYFTGRMNSFAAGGNAAADADNISDTIVLTHATNDHLAVYQAIIAAVNAVADINVAVYNHNQISAPYQNGFITLFDAVNSTAIGGITAVTPAIAAAQA
jgi:hypothetical protein